MKNRYCLKTIAYSLGVCYCLFFCNNCFCQTNLVPNNSFEQIINCPSYMASPPPAPWYSATNYDAYCYYNACSPDPNIGIPYNIAGGVGSFQYPRTGNAYIGLYYYSDGNNIHEYAQAKLKQTLKVNRKYYAECFVSLGNGELYGCNNVGMLFTSTAISVDTVSFPWGVLVANPQILNYHNPIITDTLNWVKISGILKAQGGEQYLTLGNFKNDNQTSYHIVNPAGYAGSVYYVDDVSVYELDSFNLKADAGRDTTIHIGDSAFIGSLTNGIDSVKWQVLNTNGTIDSIRPGFWVHPLVNTCYVLTQTVNGYTSSDTVCVTVNPLPLKFISYSVISNEVRNLEKSVENRWQTANEINVSHFYVQRSTNGINYKIIGQIKAQNKTLNSYSFVDEEPQEGTNYYRIIAVDIDGKLSYSEVRQLIINHSSLNIKIYPNPAHDVVNIECKEGIKEVMIIDCLGRVVYREILLQAQNDATIINIKDFNKGLYVVQVIFKNGEVKTEKLIVE